MENLEPCSRILSHILDNIGYCGWLINDRKKVYSERSKYLYNVTGKEILIAGSKGEGLSNILQSDIDTLCFCDCMCGVFEKDVSARADEIGDPARYMFKVERDWTPPGYCMLILDSRFTQTIRDEVIEQCLFVIDAGVTSLQSESLLRQFSESVTKGGLPSKPVAGPSQPTVLFQCVDSDWVLTFSCPCSAELDAWYKRPRHHDWPSKSLQQDVRSTPANVVPVGSKYGIFNKNEWRFCFNKAELKLIDSLNLPQKKVYVVLKMILKDYLKPENKEITSYVMKNIVFWMCESNPVSSFTPSTLLSWIYVGLQTLKDHIETGNLPYYMIPERNLLDGKFSDDITKKAYLDKMSQLLESGACLVHVCDAIQFGLELYNEGLLEDYGWKRNLVEIYQDALSREDLLPREVQVKRDLLHLAGVDDPLSRVLLPDAETLKLQGYAAVDMFELRLYRQGLFLNPEKAESFAQLPLGVFRYLCGNS